jgi:hypothetical protein
MPPGTLPPVVLPFDPTSTVPVSLVALDNKDQPEQVLFDVARYEVRNMVMSRPGAIASVVRREDSRRHDVSRPDEDAGQANGAARCHAGDGQLQRLSAHWELKAGRYGLCHRLEFHVQHGRADARPRPYSLLACSAPSSARADEPQSITPCRFALRGLPEKLGKMRLTPLASVSQKWS